MQYVNSWSFFKPKQTSKSQVVLSMHPLRSGTLTVLKVIPHACKQHSHANNEHSFLSPQVTTNSFLFSSAFIKKLQKTIFTCSLNRGQARPSAMGGQFPKRRPSPKQPVYAGWRSDNRTAPILDKSSGMSTVNQLWEPNPALQMSNGEDIRMSKMPL